MLLEDRKTWFLLYFRAGIHIVLKLLHFNTEIFDSGISTSIGEFIFIFIQYLHFFPSDEPKQGSYTNRFYHILITIINAVLDFYFLPDHKINSTLPFVLQYALLVCKESHDLFAKKSKESIKKKKQYTGNSIFGSNKSFN